MLRLLMRLLGLRVRLWLLLVLWLGVMRISVHGLLLLLLLLLLSLCNLL
jgi:hypothetical protein